MVVAFFGDDVLQHDFADAVDEAEVGEARGGEILR